MLQVAQAQRGQVLEHLVFQLVAVDHQQDGRLVRLGRAEEQFGRLDHGEGLAAALGVPDEAARPPGIEGAADDRLHRAGLVLAQDVFVQLLVLLGKDDVVLQEGEHLRDGAEALHLGLQLADLLVLPVEDVPPHRVPGHPVGKADGVGGGEELLRHEQLGRLAVVTADLIHPQGNRLVLVGVLALDHQHRDAVDEKDHILPRAVVAVVKGPLLGDLIDVRSPGRRNRSGSGRARAFPRGRRTCPGCAGARRIPGCRRCRCGDGGTARARRPRPRRSAG